MQCKLAFKLPSAALLLQRYAFLLKDARNYWKIFEGEGDKIKKVYPRLPDVLGKKDTPNYIYIHDIYDCLFHNLSCRVALLHDQYTMGGNIRETEVLRLRLIYLLTLHIIYIGVRSRDVLLNRNGRDSRSAIL